MSAEADDLRYHYSETLGRTQAAALTSGASERNAEKLTPGKYVARVRAVAGAATVWLHQGGSTVNAAAAAPSTPFEIHATIGGAADAAAANKPLATFIVRGESDAYLAGILNAGTATLIITKVSRGVG